MPAKTPQKTRTDNQVDLRQALKLKTNGASYTEIAKMQGVSKQAVHKALKNILPTEYTTTYKDQRADILAHLQLKMLNSIDDAAIEKAPMGSRVLAACQLYDKERTERGLTNSISAVVHSDIEALRRCNTDQYSDVIDIDSDD